jgi:hypothetical protein
LTFKYTLRPAEKSRGIREGLEGCSLSLDAV